MVSNTLATENSSNTSPMKKLKLLLLCLLSMNLPLLAQEASQKFSLKMMTVDQEGNKVTIEREYDSPEAMQKDREKLKKEMQEAGMADFQMHSFPHGEEAFHFPFALDSGAQFNMDFNFEFDHEKLDSMVHIQMKQVKVLEDSMTHPFVFITEGDSAVADVLVWKNQLEELPTEEEIKAMEEKLMKQLEKTKLNQLEIEKIIETTTNALAEAKQNTAFQENIFFHPPHSRNHRTVKIADLNQAEQSESKWKSLPLERIQLKASPGQIELSFSAPSKNTLIQLLDAEMQALYQEEYNGFDGHYEGAISTQNLQNGHYRLQIIQGKKAYQKKIVVE
ncbi:hypothetical protein PEDI_00610 [Persicobacter diffluens]|uniref:Uncharacterized protein n=2 Tax=Persicobacter diffluens TaxID=981 RepID=A0AAN4VUF2_9BACT|nr:hypothetical protein PEDI_00610 [Persicobacter diffluens]